MIYKTSKLKNMPQEKQKGFSKVIILMVFLFAIGGAFVYWRFSGTQSEYAFPARENKKMKTPTRDERRVSDIKVIQAGLEMVAYTCGSYPTVSTLTNVGSSEFSTSFCQKATISESFRRVANPQPGGRDYQYCSETVPGSGECGAPLNGKTESYRLVFETEDTAYFPVPYHPEEGKKSDWIPSGVHIVTPRGIQ